MTDTATQTPRTPFYVIGGTAAFRDIVSRFYDLMDGDPAYAELRAMHGEDLEAMRDALTAFLSGWAGGPRDWFEANPGRCMFSVHGKMPIDSTTAGQWADAMERAIAAADVANRDMADQLGAHLGKMARSMAGVPANAA